VDDVSVKLAHYCDKGSGVIATYWEIPLPTGEKITGITFRSQKD